MHRMHLLITVWHHIIGNAYQKPCLLVGLSSALRLFSQDLCKNSHHKTHRHKGPTSTMKPAPETYCGWNRLEQLLSYSFGGMIFVYWPVCLPMPHLLNLDVC